MTLEERVLKLDEEVNELSNIVQKMRGIDEVEVFIEPIDENHIPVYAHPTDAGADLISAVDCVLEMGASSIISTGIKVAIPEGYEIQVRPRSGISAKTTLRESNSPGTIDTGYRDTVGVILYRDTNPIASFKNPELMYSTIDGKEVDQEFVELMTEKLGRPISAGAIFIRKGDRVAQMVLNKVCKAKFTVVDDVSTIGENRGGGFGHTGIN